MIHSKSIEFDADWNNDKYRNMELSVNQCMDSRGTGKVDKNRKGLNVPLATRSMCVVCAFYFRIRCSWRRGLGKVIQTEGGWCLKHVGVICCSSNERVALSIGDHDRDEFETPFLQSPLHPTIIVQNCCFALIQSIHTPKQPISIPSTLQDRWTERVIDDLHSVSLVENTIDTLINDGMNIDTIFVDISDNSSIFKRLAHVQTGMSWAS